MKSATLNYNKYEDFENITNSIERFYRVAYYGPGANEHTLRFESRTDVTKHLKSRLDEKPVPAIYLVTKTTATYMNRDICDYPLERSFENLRRLKLERFFDK